jgi:hypothetical protein
MDFLPRLIPGTLSLHINATLAAVRNKSNNGYDYLWRVLELTVPWFDPVIPIQTPQWLDCNDIFQFSQAYLLYFCLHSKMHYHFTDCTRSGIFLCAIQHSDYADTVTTLQSHVNSYREDYDTKFLSPHLCLHGLAERNHLNAQACLWDVISPQIRRLGFGQSLIQDVHQSTPRSPAINCLSRLDCQGVGIYNHDGGRAGNRNNACPGRDDYPHCLDTCASSDWNRAPRGGGCLAHPGCNRRPFLPDVQCAACKQVGHVAKHCDMLATAICLE